MQQKSAPAVPVRIFCIQKATPRTMPQGWLSQLLLQKFLDLVR